jgi:hypothetical protein
MPSTVTSALSELKKSTVMSKVLSYVTEEEAVGSVPAGLECHLKDAYVEESVLDDLIGYACTVIDCSPIQPGGSDYPCEKPACADYVLNALFQKNYPTVEFAIDMTCYNGGVAQTSARANHFFLELLKKAPLDSGMATADKDVDVTKDLITVVPGETYDYEIGGLNLTHDIAAGPTFFQGLWVAQAEGEKANEPCTIGVQIDYDFNGDGSKVRTEVYPVYLPGAFPQFSNYNSGQIAAPKESGGYMESFAGGSVKLSLSSTGCKVAVLQGTTGGPPASITVPHTKA